MMQIDIKAAVMLLITLLLGVALGGLGAAALSRQRTEQVRELRRPPGFLAHMEEVIAPHDSAQRARVEAILTATAARNDSILQGANTQLRAALDSMRTRLAPMLDPDQRSRLENAARLAPPLRGAGGGRGERPPPGEGPPPDGREGPRGGPPPDGRLGDGPDGRRGGPPDGRRGGPPPGGPPPPSGAGPGGPA